MSETQWRPVQVETSREIKRWRHEATGVQVYIEEYGGGAYRSMIENPPESGIDKISVGPELPIGPFPNEDRAIVQTESWIFEQGAALVPSGETQPDTYE